MLGIDDQGREVLTFVPGDAVTPPYPAWALTDDALRSVAVLLRRYHEAVAGFEPAGHDWPAVAPPEFDEGLACHYDLNLDNVIFRGGRAAALIDFDWANPGSAVWDVAGRGSAVGAVAAGPLHRRRPPRCGTGPDADVRRTRTGWIWTRSGWCGRYASTTTGCTG